MVAHITEVKRSELDRSVNFIFSNDAEARYVKREGDGKVLAYISSQTGCKQACRFCHLTQKGYTRDDNVSFLDMKRQLLAVLNEHHDSKSRVDYEESSKLHINFMARGEPMLNPEVVHSDWFGLVNEYAPEFEGQTRINVSTIMPKGLKMISPDQIPTHFFYSLYSVDDQWRRRWIPNAMNKHKARQMLNEYSNQTGLPITIHYALIKGENDSLDDAKRCAEFLSYFDQKPRFNLVRYNTFNDDRLGVEADQEQIDQYLNIIDEQVFRARIVPRVGRDVDASCGTFSTTD